MKFFLLIDVEMPTTVGISILMSRKNNILGLSEPEKRLISWYILYQLAFKISCSAELSMKQDLSQGQDSSPDSAFPITYKL